jgi:hypothetical protein
VINLKTAKALGFNYSTDVARHRRRGDRIETVVCCDALKTRVAHRYRAELSNEGLMLGLNRT